MKMKSLIHSLLSILIVLFLLVTLRAAAQEVNERLPNKGLFIEFGGSGIAMLTANFDFRFGKGRNDGLGMRVGIGGESSKTEPLFGSGEIITKLFTVPLEVNYIFGKKRFSFETGYSLTYVYESTNSSFRFLDPYYTNDMETGKSLVSYLPVGFRLKPKRDGFMLKFNVGPLWNYSAANVFDKEKFLFWAGLAMGYSFH